MKNRLSSFLPFAAMLLLAQAAYSALPAAVNNQSLPSLAPIVSEVSPAVVNIQVRGTTRVSRQGSDPFREFFGIPNPRTPQAMRSAGSGVIVDAANGYILTNHHVIADADDIEIILFDERTFKATVVGSDEGTDIAVLKVDEKNLVDIAIGNSDMARVGDFVIAIGNPFGLQHTVTSGIVSALGRSGINREGYEDFIQTDASINPGNSGGALVNLSGELIGINSAIISRTGGNVGIGFAIPSNMAQSIMRQLLDFGEVRRGLLGVSIDTINANNSEALGLKNVTGAIVQSVSPGSAAEKAGIEVNDIVTAVNGDKVDSASDLRNAIGLLRSGDSVGISVLRDGRVKNVNATLDELLARAVADAAEMHPGLAGARLETSDEGVLVAAVAEGSEAAQRGLRAGDLIRQINRDSLDTVEDMRVLTARAPGGVLFLEIERAGRPLVLQFR